LLDRSVRLYLEAVDVLEGPRDLGGLREIIADQFEGLVQAWCLVDRDWQEVALAEIPRSLNSAGARAHHQQLFRHGIQQEKLECLLVKSSFER